jgi:hypothetical protein
VPMTSLSDASRTEGAIHAATKLTTQAPAYPLALRAERVGGDEPPHQTGMR